MREVFFSMSSSGSPDTPEWHSWRMGGIGGSDAPVIAADAGLIRERPAWLKSLEHLWMLKTGAVQEDLSSSNPATERGKRNEETARRLFEEQTGILVSPCFGEMDEHGFVRASFDGMSLDGDTIVEIKVPSEKVHGLAKEGEVVEYYRPQIAHQALVAWGMPEGWKDQTIFFVSLQPETQDLAVVETPAKDLRGLAERLLSAEIDFWGHVMNRTPPCGPEWQEAAQAYISAYAELERAQALVDEAKSRLVSLLGNRDKAEGAGVSVTRFLRKGSVDYLSMLRALLPDMPEEELKAHCERFRKESVETVAVRILKGGGHAS